MTRIRMFGLLAAVALIAAAACGTARAGTLYVGPGEAFTTIQAAIDDASDLDEIIVRDGAYTGDGNRDILFGGKNVCVRSENGPKNCILDLEGSASDQHRGFILINKETADAKVQGFTIKNAYNQNIGTKSGIGGAVFADGSSPTITGNIIINNYASSRGAGIATYNGSPIITNNVIMNNGGGRGSGGIIAWWDGGVLLDAPIMITGNMIVNNTAIFGGGTFIWGAKATLINNTYFGNTASGSTDINNMGHGGGVILNGGGKIPAPETILLNCVFWGNNAEWPDGTGDQISCQSGNSSVISYCDIQGGQAGILVHPQQGVAPAWGDGNIDADPLFADTANGDFRLKSSGGRWNGSAWVTDTADSPCIDAGDPASAFANEPDLNGGRINMGFDGNTALASKSKPSHAWPIPGDANLDCKVNILDLIWIRNKLGSDIASGNNWQADVNQDGKINILDLIYVRNRLSTKCAN